MHCPEARRLGFPTTTSRRSFNHHLTWTVFHLTFLLLATSQLIEYTDKLPYLLFLFHNSAEAMGFFSSQLARLTSPPAMIVTIRATDKQILGAL